MKCHRCEVCGKPIERDEDNSAKLCLSVLVDSGSGRAAHCWCVCDDCRDEFLQRSAKVFAKNDIKALP